MLKINMVERIKGEITVPGDKSISHRAIMLGSISSGRSEVRGFLAADDCLSTIGCLRSLGVEIQQIGTNLIIEGKGLMGLREPSDYLNAGNSGTTMRLLAGILAGQPFFSIITGDSSLRKRPMERIATPLREMGAAIDGRGNGRLAPLAVRGGNLRGIDYKLPVSSAQVKSAVLLAGLYAGGVTRVFEEHQSRDHTERMLKAFGADIQREGNSTAVAASKLYGQQVEVPGDISSAAFFMVAAAAKIGSCLVIKGVGLNPTRTGIIDVLKAMGAKIELFNLCSSGGEAFGDILVEGAKLNGICIERSMIPSLIDEIPVIAVAAALAEGTTRITGAEELKFKESNRISAVVVELKKLGVDIKELPDGMEIKGPNAIQGGSVDSYGDHRIAMAMAIAGLYADGEVIIGNDEYIAVSFPQFQKALKLITG